MKKLIVVLFISILSSTAFAEVKEFKAITCKYSADYRDEYIQAKFFLKIDSMKVESSEKAVLDYAVYLNLEEEEIWIDKNKALTNVKYNGRKYNNHFKFEFDLARASEYNGSSGAYANLIIAKEVTKTEVDQYGAQIETFEAALDVSYNDHHGDYVPLTCTRRYFAK